MSLKFFKRKMKPEPSFTTIEVECNGVTYGYCLNWFKKYPNGELAEVKIADLPESILNYQITSMVNGVSRDLNKMMEQFEQSLKERINFIDKIIKETPEFTVD